MKTKSHKTKILFLTLIRQWFDEIHFRNGYSAKAPFMRVKWKGLGYKTFSGEKNFAIRLGRVLETKYWRGPK
jgi:hypothetical protein